MAFSNPGEARIGLRTGFFQENARLRSLPGLQYSILAKSIRAFYNFPNTDPGIFLWPSEIYLEMKRK